MRRLFRWLLLALAAVLLALGVYHGLKPKQPQVYAAGTGSVALGLVLLNSEEGVYVLAVSDQSQAYFSGLEPGDYILAADGMEIDDATALDELLAAGGPSVELTVQRLNEQIQLTLTSR